MATTPPPAEPAGGDSNIGGGDDWRSSVLQSYRNAEVREIAKVLAALEPGATSSSKLMLAMRFEDTIFKAASSLVDYRKRIAKRLKKLQKNYVPPVATPSSERSDVEVLLGELRRKYEDALKYIIKYAPKAIQDVEDKTGEERGNQLRQHTNSALEWAKQLGVSEEEPLSVKEAASNISHEQLKKTEQHLERRVDNIRTYVVKHADPDLFLQETVEKKDRDLKERANKMLGVNLQKRIEQLQEKTLATMSSEGDPAAGNAETTSIFNATKVLQEALDKAQAVIPPPTRNNQNNDTPAALIHLDKMRAASTALMAYFCIPDRQTTAPRNSLTKIMSIANEGADFIKQACNKLPKPATDQVQLADAWNKELALPISAPSILETGEQGEESPSKRQKLNGMTTRRPPYLRTRVLLTPSRKTPPNLIPALRRKRAKLVRPALESRGSHLVMEFDKAFAMTIYFSPLLVTIRAMEEKSVKDDDDASPLLTQVGRTPGCATWTPLYHGLTHRQDLGVWGIQDTSYDAIGRVVEERLRDASMQATYVLRKCFQNHVKDKVLEFEVEILEASALLEFLQIARTTFIPNWQDDD